ncbi:MAG: methyl-accepting chemotaxis protein [Candidatus Margulisbacteria bacterium]|nr:methyl-accepting chemotaxis protein [Candidatus Margulisiibacteriota bacterium]
MTIKKKLYSMILLVLAFFMIMIFIAVSVTYKQKSLIKDIYENKVKTMENISKISESFSLANSTLLKLGILAMMGENSSIINSEADTGFNIFNTAFQNILDLINNNNVINKNSDQFKKFTENTETYKSLYKKISAAAIAGDVYSAQEFYPHAQKTFNAMIDFLNTYIIKKQSDITLEAYKNSQKTYQANLFLLVFVSLTAMCFLVVFIYLIIKSILEPLFLFSSNVDKIIKTGDFSIQIDYKNNDEFKQIINAFNVFMNNLKLAVSGVNQVMEALAHGDYSKRVFIDLKGDLHTMKTNINSTVGDLGSAITSINEVMEAVAQGDFKQKIMVSLNGELDILKENINSSIEMLGVNIDSINVVMDAVSKNDLKQRICSNSYGDINKLIQNINNSLETLASSLQNIANYSISVVNSTDLSNQVVGEMVQSADILIRSISDIKEATNDAHKSIEYIVDNASTANAVSEETFQLVKKGQNKISGMVNIIQSISENSLKISKITDVIGEIANQTNLLSLNAAIEAARAGEHGKGFAVVADEVRKLAENVSSYVKEISDLVSKAVKEIEIGVASATEVHEDMGNMTDSVSKNSSMIQSISSLINQQKVVIEGIQNNVINLSQFADKNNSIAKTITSSSRELSTLAKKTMTEVKKFTI